MGKTQKEREVVELLKVYRDHHTPGGSSPDATLNLETTFRFHDLRHTCATLLLRQGVHVKFVQELLGHGDIAINLNV